MLSKYVLSTILYNLKSDVVKMSENNTTNGDPNVNKRRLTKSVSLESSRSRYSSLSGEVYISSDLKEVRFSKESGKLQSNESIHGKNEVIRRVQTTKARKVFSIKSISEGDLHKRKTIAHDPRRQWIKEFLSKVISVRTGAREQLQKRGLLKSNLVFGSTISAIAKTDGTKVPKFLTKCISLIADNPSHMNSEGLYRRNGNMATIQSLRFEVDQGRLIKLDLVENVHILTGLIKLFFRELSSPLIPWSTIEKLADAYDKISKTDDKKKRGKELRTVGQIISTLHPANRDTLFFLLEHLYAVSGFSDVNQMNNENLAMMLGPTLSWTQDLTNMTTMASMMIKQNNVVGCLIRDCKQLRI
eukprot:GFUD01014765.1.p1 GENE.GFUD01014765.1~~GFUD01014765.1.p1  ORF type:complete len:358 (+),score=82.60 GFUD01014765.1:63-1136(+)